MPEVRCVIETFTQDSLTGKLKFSRVSECTIEDTSKEDDPRGEERYYRIGRECSKQGYWFKYYTLSDVEGFSYKIVVKYPD